MLEPSSTYLNTPRADVYALGKLLFVLLTGRLPVERGAMSLAEYLMALRDWQPLHPARFNAEVVREAVAEDDGELHAVAPRIKALPETLLSSVRLTARRSLSEDWRVRLDSLRRSSRRYAPLAAMVACFAALDWLGWSVSHQLAMLRGLLCLPLLGGTLLAEARGSRARLWDVGTAEPDERQQGAHRQPEETPPRR